MGFWLALIIAAAAGATMAVQGALNSLLSKSAGLVPAVVVVQALALVTALLVLLLLPGESLRVAALARAPWYTYIGGILGVVITLTVMQSISRVGVYRATTAIIAAQILTAVLIDHLGLWGLQKLPFTWQRLVGALLLIAGAWVLLRR